MGSAGSSAASDTNIKKGVRYNLRNRSLSDKCSEKEGFYTLAEYNECFDDDFSVFVVELPTKEHSRPDVLEAKEKEL